MTSPDLPAAVDLTVHRVTETDILDAAVAAFQLRVPEWNPVEGDLEATLLEAMAVAVGQDVYAINQIPPVVLAGLLQLWGVERKPGTTATGLVKVTMPSGTTGARTLPAGTGMRVINTNGVVMDLVSVDDVVSNPALSLDFYVNARFIVAGVLGNGVPAGTTVSFTEPLSWIESAVLFTPTSGGTDDEADDEYFARAAAFLRSRTSALVVNSQFESFAINQVGVGRAKAVSLWDGTGATVGSVTGHVTVAVAGPTGAALTAPAKTAIQAAMSALVVAGLVVHVVDPVYSAGTVTVAVDAQPGVDKPSLASRVQSVVAGWWSASSWPWGTTLFANDLIGRVAQIPGVLRVTATGGTGVGAAVTSPIGLPPVAPTVTATVN